jgi:hypothetical protein
MVSIHSTITRQNAPTNQRKQKYLMQAECLRDNRARRVRKFELTLVRDKREMLRKLGQPIDL